MNVKNLIDEEIRSEIEGLSKMGLGDDTYKNTVSGVTQLTDRYIKMEELALEQRKMDVEYKKIEIEQQKVDDDKNDKKTRNRIAIGTAVTGVIITVAGTILGYVMEERGTILTTKPGNKSMDRMLNYFFGKK